MYLSPLISAPVFWLLVASFICVLLLAILYLLRVRPVLRHWRHANFDRQDKADADYIPASVVVYSQGDSETLEDLLRSLLTQDYPTDYEVIVVNEGESADVRDTVNMLRAQFPNLYLTFTPEGVVNLSRKKLALTLGIKAARYEVTVLTTTSAVIESPLWLRKMMHSFDKNGNIDIVLGYAYAKVGEDKAFGYRCRAFDQVADSVRWLAVAVAGHPFRGTEFNIAYRKKTFLENKGFARSLNLHYGDDDIFISEIANGKNTAVELSDESMVQVRYGNHPRVFNERMLHHVFTERFIRRRPRFLFPMMGWLQIAAIAMAITAIYINLPNLLATCIGAAIILLMFAIDCIFWRPVMKAFKSRALLFTLPWFTVTYPFRRIIRTIRSRLNKHKTYTWT